MLKYIFSIAAILILAGCGGVNRAVLAVPEAPAVQDREKYVEVEGEAEVVPVPENELVTRKNGVDAARRAVIEKALGVYVTGQQMISKSLLIQEKIFSKTAGYIKEEKVLSESMSGPYWKTKLWAKVRIGNIKNDIDALDLMIKTTAGNPRVVVLLEEYLDGVKQETSNAATFIMGDLLSKGYKVVDQQQLDKIKADDLTKAAAAGDEKAAAGIAKRYDADVAVTGKVALSANLSDSDYYKGWYIGQASINAKVVKTTTGQLLYAVSKTAKMPDISKEAAVANVSQKLGEAVSPEFSGGIAVKLSESSMINLSLSGFKTINQLEDFRKFLKTFEQMIEVTVRSFDEGAAEFELNMAYGSAGDFALKLEKSNKGVKVLETGGHLIKARIER
ncbi:MAG: hypothetical protein WCI43_00365 [Candidatus Firestonebacteria bacterium]